MSNTWKPERKKQIWNFREIPEDPAVTALMPGFEIQYMITKDTVEGNDHQAVFGHCVFPGPSSHDKHIHTKSAEIIYVIKGKVLSCYTDQNGEDVENLCGEGSATFAPPNVIHWVKNPFEEPAEFVFFYSCAHDIEDSGYFDYEPGMEQKIKDGFYK